MEPISRIALTQMSRKQLDNQTVQSEYKAGYCLITVTSKFGGSNSLCDLFLEIISKQQRLNCRPGQHEFSAQNAPAMV
jgi:hypothetical protein